MSKRSYSDDKKSAALAYYDATGGRLRKTARDLGIPIRTLRSWLNGRSISAECAEMRTQKKRDLANWLEELAADLIDAAPDKIAKAGLKDIGITLGIAIEKMQLLRGEPTAITGDAAQWQQVAEQLAAKYNKPVDEVKRDLIARKPELASVLIQ